MKLLSVDPGTVCSGWVLSEDRKLIDCNKIQITASWKQSKRLAHLMWGIETILDEYDIDVLAIEDQFVGTNARTSLVTARAKGIVIAAAAMRDIKVIEYAPSEIKRAVTGNGNAKKQLVTEKVLSLYGNYDIVKKLGPFCDKGKNKNDDIFDAFGIDHTYWTLGETKEEIVKNKTTKEKTLKIVSRVI